MKKLENLSKITHPENSLVKTIRILVILTGKNITESRTSNSS